MEQIKNEGPNKYNHTRNKITNSNVKMMLSRLLPPKEATYTTYK